jgi:hypothetical protein
LCRIRDRSAIVRELYGDRWNGEALAPRHVGRIVETELWDVEDLDVMDPAHLTLEDTIRERATRVGLLDARPRERRARQPRGD